MPALAGFNLAANSMPEESIETKIARLEEQLGQIHEAVLGDTGILKNDLPHIYKRLGRIEIKNAYYSGGLAIVMILVGLFLKFY